MAGEFQRRDASNQETEVTMGISEPPVCSQADMT